MVFLYTYVELFLYFWILNKLKVLEEQYNLNINI